MYRRHKNSVSFTYVLHLEAAVRGEPYLMFCIVMVLTFVFQWCLAIRLRGSRYPSMFYIRPPLGFIISGQMIYICCAPIILTKLGCHYVLLLYFIQSRTFLFNMKVMMSLVL
ncbi:hypothetical protein EDD18DRAFT_1178024 [Armillaria luteobubalina]|uniref:Uncharacterized protein n=1 Tax=Armillaria luteobubalina TaxID=153913 RepID=A0AA39Q061_9AGAR|nr:hypothetical protein EDD18DRAFT_1178024 [Armillaria luteobubalina]